MIKNYEFRAIFDINFTDFEPKIGVLNDILVQNLDPCECDCEDCGLFFRNVMTFVVGSITIFAGLIVVCHFFVLRSSNKRSSYEIIERDEDDDPLS